MGVELSQIATAWQTDTIAWIGIGLEVASTALYIYGVARVRRSGRSWPLSRGICFGLGLASLAFVLQSGFASYDDTILWVHMTQHLVIMMLAAPLLALGASDIHRGTFAMTIGGVALAALGTVLVVARERNRLAVRARRAAA